MRRFQSILFVTRGTVDESDALRQALSLARSHAAALHAVVICPLLSKDLGEYQAGFESSLAERVRASVTKVQAALGMRPSEVLVTVEVECGDTSVDHIVRLILRNTHDLLVKQAEPTDRETGFRALDIKLLRLCPCPVWLCRTVTPAPMTTRVAVAVNPKSIDPAARDLALQLLQLTRSLTDRYDEELNIISCWDFAYENDLRHSPWGRAPEEIIQRNLVAAEQDHQAALQQLIRESGIAGRVRVHNVRGSPEQAIVRFVDSLAVDILVMGTVARSGIQGFLIGNTAESVVRQIRCSLLALKPNGFASSVRAYG